MSRENARNNWYILMPDGGAQVLVHIGRDGRMDAMAEEANFAEHLTANDRFAGWLRAIANGDTSPDVTADEAAAVVSAWDADADPALVTVERIA